MKKVSVTDKYTYDGIEMTERDIEMYEVGKNSFSNKLTNIQYFFLGCLLMTIIGYIIEKTSNH